MEAVEEGSTEENGGRDRGRKTGDGLKRGDGRGLSYGGSCMQGKGCGLYLIITGSQAAEKPDQICILKRSG